MLSATKHLSPANEILRFAQDDTSGGSLLRFMYVGYPLAPTHLANDAGASVLIRSDNAATQLADAQSEREATASQSGKS